MDFGKPTSDRDGCWVAKFDIKSDRGTNPVEIRQSLAEMLSPLSLKSANFDKLAAKFTGSYQKISFSFTIEPTLLNGLPTHIVKHANMVSGLYEIYNKPHGVFKKITEVLMIFAFPTCLIGRRLWTAN